MKPADFLKRGHASRFDIARLLAGELSKTERFALTAHLQSCPECSRIRDEAQAAAQALAEKFPARQHLDSAQRSRQGPGPRRASGGMGLLWERLLGTARAAGAFRSALAGLILLLAGASLVWFGPSGTPRDLSAKGGGSGASFHLAVKGKAGQAEARGDTLAVSAGDTLQLGLVSAVPVHYAVLYRDDGGEILSYLASGTEGLPPAGSPEGENLPNSLVLDGARSREDLFALSSERPITFEEARARVAAGNTGYGIGTAAPRGDIQVRAWHLVRTRP